MQTLWQDLRYAVRMLKRNPGFAGVAVLTLAVAIGANAVVFSVMHGLIFRALNVPQPESLFTLEHGSDKDPSESYPDYLDLRDRNRSFDSLIAYNISQVALDTGKNPSRAWVYEVSANYFDALGIQPYLGRLIHPSDEHAPDIVLTYAYFHSHFQDDRSVVGRVLHLNRHPFTVIGVTPPGFRGTVLIFSPDFFVPIVNQEQDDAANLLNARGNRWIGEVLGHLKAGVTPAQALADLNAIGSALEKSYPKEDAQMSFSLERSGLPGGSFGSAVQAFIAGLTLLAGLILLAACANLGSLFAARAADRSREVALRLALGAGRTRILRQLFTEALLISLMGGAAGLWGSVGLSALVGRVGAVSAIPSKYAGECGRNRLWSRIALEFSQWAPVWRRSGQAGASHRSLSGYQVGSNRLGGAPPYHPRYFAWLADRNLRSAGHFFGGRCAWTGSLAA